MFIEKKKKVLSKTTHVKQKIVTELSSLLSRKIILKGFTK